MSNSQVVSTTVIQSGPPVKVDDTGDEEVYATTKQEEWVTSKRVQSTTKKQIETRVKRQVVLEDGQVVQDSGPEVITNVTENTDTQENNASEHRTSGDDPQVTESAVALQDAPRIRTEKKEKTVNTKEEYVDITREDSIENLGDLTNDELVLALREKSDVRLAIAKRQDSTSTADRPKLAKYHTSHHHKTVDTEDVREKQEVKEDGEVITETTRTKQWEEYDNEQVPDSGTSDSEPEDTKQTSHSMVHTKDENIIEYVAVPRGGTLAQGVKVGEGMRYVSENIQEEKTGNEEDMAHRVKKHKKLGLSGKAEALERKDALTKKPLDFDEEEETRKLETSRWLESHFGSDESYKSHTSVCEEEVDNSQPVYGGNVIKITMGAKPRVSNKSSEHQVNRPQRRDSFFQGITQWDKGESRQYKTETDIKRERRHSSSREPPISSPDPIGPPQFESTPVKSYQREVKSPPPHSPPPPAEEKTYKPWQRKNPVKYGPLRQEYNRIVEELKNEERMKSSFSKEEKARATNGVDHYIVTSEVTSKVTPPPPKRPERRKPNKSGSSQSRKVSSHKEKTDASHEKVISHHGNNVYAQPKTKPSSMNGNEHHKKYYDPAWNSHSTGTQTSETREISTQTLHEKPIKKYYLGEDPFQGGMFRGAPPPRHKKSLNSRRRGSVDDVLTERSSETLGRHPRREQELQGTRSQTLPRRLKSASASPNRRFYYGDNRGMLNNSELDRSLNDTKIGGSMINVSFVNNVKGERKSSVNRSQSFNVSSPSVSVLKRAPRPPHFSNLNKSTPHLSDAMPLRSPDVLKGISRSSSMRQEYYDRPIVKDKRREVEVTSVQPEHMDGKDVPETNGIKDPDSKKKTFLQGLLNTAPELYYHLEGNAERQHSSTPPDSPPALISPEELPMSQKIHMYEAEAKKSTRSRVDSSGYKRQITKSTPNLVHSVSMRSSTAPSYHGLSHSPSFNSWSRNHSDAVRIVSGPSIADVKPSGGVIIQVRDWNSR